MRPADEEVPTDMDPTQPRSRSLLPRGSADLSLRARLLALLCAAALLPMGVIGALESRTTSGNLSTERQAKFREIAYQVSVGVDRVLAERFGDTLAFASGDDAQSMDPRRITGWMRTILPLYAPNYRLLAVADARGRLVAVQTADEGGRPNPTPAGLTGTDVGGEAWFQGAARGDLAEGTSFVDGPAPDRLLARAGDGDTRTIGFSAPIRDARGRTVGVWTSRFSFDVVEGMTEELQQHLRANGLTGAQVTLVAGDGVVLHASGGRPADGARLEDPVVRRALSPGATGTAQTAALDGGGGSVLVGYHRSAAEGRLAGLDWAVLVTQDAREATRPAAAAARRTVLLGLVIAAIMVVLAFLISGAVMRRLREYSAFAGRVANGDLTARVSTSGAPELRELSGHLNDMAVNLRHLSTEVRGGAQGVGAAATEILATVSEQGSSLTEQSAAISQTSATAEELRAAAEHTAGRAREVAERAQAASKASDEGTDVVDGIVAGMEEIRERVEAIAKDILALSEQTQQIGEITATVDDLAEQSNLLALNATIEAARAGEQGRGFAVVAAEVRNLAELSRQGTGQVRAILSDIQRATNEAVLATEQGIKVVERGRGRAQRAGEVIGQLGDTVRDTAQAAQQIAASAHEQQVAVDQIAVAMREINQATSQFVTGASDSRSAAEGLNGLARELQLLTERYRVEVG
jgi:methyl-accepting chemotaxis protein